jgi:Holliday junction resolvasome RuvABC endonuclease subunit
MLGIDPSLTHTGYAVCEVCTETRKIIRVLEMSTIKTEKTKNKQVRSSSDKMHRARAHAVKLREVIAQHQIRVGAAEVPSGGQSANAASAFGIAIGILASLTIPLIEVSPAEVKMASVGSKTADKEDIMRWALALTERTDSPVEWGVGPRKNEFEIEHRGGYILKDMEHQADAISGVQAAIASEQFRQLSGMMAALIS